MPRFRTDKGIFFVATSIVFFGLGGAEAGENGKTPRHYAPNGNFDQRGEFTPGTVGFDLADVSNAAALDRLPANVMGLVWVGRCKGADAGFRELVLSVIDHPKTFGFYLMDDPDPSGRWKEPCRPEALREEADWIHARRGDALTYVALMNIGSSLAPAYDASLGPEKTHVDLFGVAPYPCRVEWPQCRYEMIGPFVEAAKKAGVPLSAIVPTYQTFGGGGWRTDTGGAFRMPEPEEMQRILTIWSEKVPSPVFDGVYSWGAQRGDVALSASLSLQTVLKGHNLK
jgi:hypothetical protein